MLSTTNFLGLRAFTLLVCRILICMFVLSSFSFSEVVIEGDYLKWIAVGDDDNYGTATKYDIRYSTENLANWELGDVLLTAPTPSQSGMRDSAYIDLIPGAYYFCIRVRDEVWNWSLWSNVVMKDSRQIEPPYLVEWE